jgi:hypothetical protein
MSAKTGCAHSRYAGLLPIEPADDFFRPIDLKPEPIDLKPERIDLKPEDVPFPNGQPSARNRPRRFARLLIAFCTGVAVTLLWQSYGDAAKEIIASSYPWLRWIAPRPALTAHNPRPRDVIGLAAPPAPSAEKFNAMSFDLDAVGQNADKIATTIGAGRESTPRGSDQLATAQEQMTRNTDQTAISVDESPATKTSNVAVESQGDAASLQPAARLNEARPPQTFAEKGKPLSGASGHNGSCFASASAVLHNHPGASPTWTLKAPGHEGVTCWFAATRPRGSDHRRESPKEKEIVGTAEHELFAPVTPNGRGGSWEGGLP